MRAFILEIANMGRERNKGLRVLLIFGTHTDFLLRRGYCLEGS